MKSYNLFFGLIILNSFALAHYTVSDSIRFIRHEIENTEQPFDAIINLGGHCEIAYQMRLHGIRTVSLPFDWLITPFKSLYRLLENDFEGFLNKENLVFIDTPEKYIHEKNYKVNLIHDFKLAPDFLNDYDVIYQKYKRRIQRFRNILKTSTHALFIRVVITEEQAIELTSLLKKTYPENNFLILALGKNDELKTPWNIDRVKNFHLCPPIPYLWHGDPEVWEKIFMDLELLSHADKKVTDVFRFQNLSQSLFLEGVMAKASQKGLWPDL